MSSFFSLSVTPSLTRAAGQVSRALALFDFLQEHRVPFTTEQLALLISTCCRSDMTARALRLKSLMQSRRMQVPQRYAAVGLVQGQ
jgi:pentatricopeptide repeat protein